ncbi:hypothetical protein SAMN05660226_02408 [Parapedobacter luteus]|uniref:Uncharacterized protein n=1 Tax=Parapedobacter luteus TaxID=623280 RepID=A0A1T5CWB8_9SPHI|nr:hypothetical protein SAMN05660226_02408 [Parapedobacter luteus]
MLTKEIQSAKRSPHANGCSIFCLRQPRFPLMPYATTMFHWYVFRFFMCIFVLILEAVMVGNEQTTDRNSLNPNQVIDKYQPDN